MGARYTVESLNRLNADELISIIIEQQNIISKNSTKQHKVKKIRIQTIGTFTVFLNDEPLPFFGKDQDILALVTAYKGNFISNKSAFEILWPGRVYSNSNMKVFYNAVDRLKKELEEYGISCILLSNKHGMCINSKVVECDFFDDLSGNTEKFFTDFTWKNDVLVG